MRRAILINTTLLTLVCFSSLFADGAQFWTVESAKDFMEGKSEGVSILADDAITLAPRIELLAGTVEPFIWSLAAGPDGAVYAATGHEGKVVRISQSGDTTVVYDALEPEVMALAVGPDGALYIGTAPEGRVYRLGKNGGQAENYFDPEETYIWDLEFGPDGDLYVATGSKGRVYRVRGAGDGSVLLDSEEQHIIELTFDRRGNLLAGSSGSALVFEVSPEGNVQIIYDSSLKDIRSIVADSGNNLYVAAFEIRTPQEAAMQGIMPQPGMSTDQPKNDDNGQEGDQGDSSGQPRGLIIRRPASAESPAANSEIYHFDRDRFVTRVWQGSGEAVMALGLLPDERALFVTSKDRSTLHAVNSRGEVSVLNTFEQSDITDFVSTGGRTVMCASNPGKLFRLGSEYVSRGTYTSSVLNAGLPSLWGRLFWLAENPGGTSVRFRTRSGNTTRPDTTWSPWSDATAGENSELAITSPPRRHLQWQAVLQTGESGSSPKITRVEASYLRRNRPPMISPVRFMPQGLFIKTTSSPEESPEIPEIYPYEVEKLMNGSKSGSTDNPFSGTKEFNRRFRMAGWNANDPNGDELRYHVHYRGFGENGWRPLQLDMENNAVIFDTEPMADGRYLLRVTAHDSLSNTVGRAEFAHRQSSVFTVDNTSPRIGEISLRRADRDGLEVSFEVSDITSRVERVELTIDARRGELLAPEDRIADSGRERFSSVLTGVPAGEHTVSVTAYDSFGNMASRRKSVKLD